MRFVSGRIPVLGLFLLLSWPTPAQDQEISMSEAPVTFSSGVNLVVVKVVVRDKDGDTVGGLEQADFEIRDNNEVQKVARFSIEESDGVAPRVAAEEAITPETTADRPRLAPGAARTPEVIPEEFVAYVFDDVNTAVGDLVQVRQAAVRQLNEAVSPTRRVAIYTISGQTTLDFTDDREEILETVGRIRRYSPDGGTECPDLNYYWADLIVNRGDTMAFSVALEETKTCMGVGADPDAAAQLTRSAAISKLGRGQREGLLGMSSLDNVVRKLATMPGTRTLVYVSSGFFVDGTILSNERSLMDRAIQANVVINTLDARGLYAATPGGGIEKMGAANPMAAVFQMRLQSEIARANTNVLGELAYATGGTFIWNDNDYGAGLRRLAGAPEFSYVLAFAPTDLTNDGKFHSLKVTVKGRKDVDVFARAGYYAPDAAQDAQEKAREEIRDAVFSRIEQTDLPMDLSLQYFKLSDVDAELTVVAKLDVSTFGFQKAEDRNSDVVTVVSAVFDRNGNFVKGVQRVIDFNLRNETLERLLAQGGIQVRSTLDLGPGSYLVRVVVRDRGGSTIASRNGSVEIPY